MLWRRIAYARANARVPYCCSRWVSRARGKWAREFSTFPLVLSLRWERSFPDVRVRVRSPGLRIRTLLDVLAEQCPPVWCASVVTRSRFRVCLNIHNHIAASQPEVASTASKEKKIIISPYRDPSGVDSEGRFLLLVVGEKVWVEIRANLRWMYDEDDFRGDHTKVGCWEEWKRKSLSPWKVWNFKQLRVCASVCT